MSAAINWIDRHFYPGVADHWDDELLRLTILETARPDWNVLDLGAGAGLVRQMNFRGFVRRVCGVDPDPRVLQNPALDEAKVGAGEAIPFPGEEFDLVFADNVLEHLPDPTAVFREVWRILKPGGAFIFKTPNRRHYVPILARLTSHRFHEMVTRLRGRQAADTFPTLYRANTPGALRRLAAKTGFRIDELRLVESRPEYLRISAPTYLMGMAYERLLNASPLLAPLRVVMLGRMYKAGADGRALVPGGAFEANAAA